MASYQQKLPPMQPVNGVSSANPLVTAAQTSADDSMAFQLWVSQQSQTLGRLKVFHSMAKSINDQQ